MERWTTVECEPTNLVNQKTNLLSAYMEIGKTPRSDVIGVCTFRRFELQKSFKILGGLGARIGVLLGVLLGSPSEVRTAKTLANVTLISLK